jgi:large subunit ribosomal protein L4
MASSAPVLGTTTKRRTVKLDADAFGARFNGPLVHESVRAELAARRRGSASTKTRGLVSGGGAKPWRQKGTGRARAGSSRSPVWTGGGTVFGPHPRSYVFKVNRKERRAALRSALSLHAERGSLAVFDAGAFSEPSTHAAAALLAGWKSAVRRCRFATSPACRYSSRTVWVLRTSSVPHRCCAPTRGSRR